MEKIDVLQLKALRRNVQELSDNNQNLIFFGGTSGKNMAERRKNNARRKSWLWFIPIFLILLVGIGFLIFTGQYYHADESAQDALQSDDTVKVIQTDYGWLFDGPLETDAVIFYPGGKVEETAYAPLLHLLAGQGMDVCLVRMPFRLAFFGMNKAEHVIMQYSYDNWYIGGHSLGGAMAASYAAAHGSQLTGVILLAAYPSKSLSENIQTIIIYGSGDGVLNRTKIDEANRYLPGGCKKFVIEGGNHAQFGNYGFQNGDGNATISAEEQQRMTVEFIMQNK